MITHGTTRQSGGGRLSYFVNMLIGKLIMSYSNLMSKLVQTSRPTRRYTRVLGIACAGALIPLTVAGHGSASVTKAAFAKQRHTVILAMDPLWARKTSQAISKEIAGMKAIGINSVRIDADWRSVQRRGPKSFSWSQLDREVRLARAAHLAIDLVIDNCPRWAAVSRVGRNPWAQPKSAQQYATFTAHVARRYAPKGVRLFEIWNEPNDSKFFHPAANVTAYTKMLIASYKAIKKVDKSAFVISGGMAPVLSRRGNINPISFLRGMYAHGAKGHFDALGDHPYSFPKMPNTFSRSSSWSQMAQTKPSLRSIMAEHHDSGKRIWITEYGAPSGGPGGVSEKNQAAELKQAIIDARTKSWIGAIAIYTWQDLGTDRHTRADWFGLLTFKGERKPAYFAVVAAIRQRVG